MTPGSYRDAVLSHHQRVLTYAAWLGGDIEEARDVTQESFLRLWIHRSAVAPEAARTWLLRTAHRLVIDGRRRERTRRNGTATIARSIPPGTAPIDDALADEAVRAVADGIAHLPPRDRALLLLREHQGLTHAEIATVLEVPVGTVKAAVHRAKRRLVDTLSSDTANEPFPMETCP